MVKFLSSVLFILAICPSQAQNRQLHFVQFGDTIQEVDGVITLAKDSFEIQATLQDNDVVVSNLGTDSSNVDSVAAELIKREDLYCFRPGTGMSDYRDNTKKWLMVKSTDNSYWPYVGVRNYTRFDKTSVTDDGIEVTRTVNNLVFFEKELKGEFTVKDAPVNELYLIYFVNYDETESKRTRTQDRLLKIVFSK